MTENAFRARDIGLRAQKKILSRMATKTIAKTFIDGTTASLLDNIYRLAKLHVSVSFLFFCSNIDLKHYFSLRGIQCTLL